ncbi:hypothetical protein ACEPPN_013326 [Leptodophora sp. 'Broadleaf-Isolate-01']
MPLEIQYIVDDPMDIDSDLFALFDFDSNDEDDEWLHQKGVNASKAALLGSGVVAQAQATEQEEQEPGTEVINSTINATPLSPDTRKLYGFEVGENGDEGDESAPYNPRSNANAPELLLSRTRVIRQVDAVEQWAQLPADLEIKDNRIAFNNPRTAAAAAVLGRIAVARQAKALEQEPQTLAKSESRDDKSAFDDPRASAAAALCRSGVVGPAKTFEQKQLLGEKGKSDSEANVKDVSPISPPILPPLSSMAEEMGVIRSAWYLRRRPRFPTNTRPIAAGDFVIKSRVTKRHRRSAHAVAF